LSSLRLPPRSAAIRWCAAVLAAAALLFLPWAWLVVRQGSPYGATESLVVYGGLVLALAAVLAHVLLASERGSALLIVVVASVLNAVAWAGVFLLFLAAGSCSSSNAHIPPLAWVGALVIYLAGGAVGLRARWHAAWAVPVSLLLGGTWLVLLSKALIGSTGACID